MEMLTKSGALPRPPRAFTLLSGLWRCPGSAW